MVTFPPALVSKNSPNKYEDPAIALFINPMAKDPAPLAIAPFPTAKEYIPKACESFINDTAAKPSARAVLPKAKE